MHPNSLANLRPFRYGPGESGNFGGSRKAEASIREWRNALLAQNDDGSPRYTRKQIEAVASDPEAAPSKVIAAQELAVAMRDGKRWVKDKSGELKEGTLDPEPGRARERVEDRLMGKATVHVRHEKVNEPSLRELRDELNALVKEHPEALAALVEEGRGPELANISSLVLPVPPLEPQKHPFPSSSASQAISELFK